MSDDGSSRVSIIGPEREWVEEYVDPETGDVGGGYWVLAIIAEARGSDGQIHALSLIVGDDETPEHPAFASAAREMAIEALLNSMKEKGARPV